MSKDKNTDIETEFQDVQEMINPLDLTEYPTNAKIHSDESIEKLAESIKAVGFNRSVVVDENNVILAGHKSVKAGIKAGEKLIPVNRLFGRTEAQKKAFVLSENRHGELSEWDFDIVDQELEVLQDIGFDIEVTGFDISAEGEKNIPSGSNNNGNTSDVTEEKISLIFKLSEDDYENVLLRLVDIHNDKNIALVKVLGLDNVI